VCIANGIKDRHTNLDLEPGTYTISGYEALQFLRTRHGVGDGGDLGRIGNQQQYMSNLVKKLRSDEVLSNVPTLLRLATVGVDNLTPSESLADPMRMVQIALAVKDVDFADVAFLQYPTNTDPYDANRVVPDSRSAEAMWDAIEANQQLLITHENGSNEGVIIEESDEPGTETPEPNASAIALPDTIKGTTAAQSTCSNGNVRR